MIRKVFFINLLLFLVLFQAYAKNNKSTHFQKYYAKIFMQKNNLSDMYLFGRILGAQADYALWNKPNLNIGIFYGSDDHLGDYNRLKVKSIVQLLSEECFDGIFACDFNIINNTRVSKNGVSIDIFAANSINGKEVTRFFQQSLLNYDVILYVGHSRNGGGPDFLKPIYIRGTKKHDWPIYLKKKKGVKLLRSMINKIHKNKVIGIFSCRSEKYFSSTLKQNKNLDLILTGELIKSSDMDKVLYTFINYFLARGELNLNDSILTTLSSKQLLYQSSSTQN